MTNEEYIEHEVQLRVNDEKFKVIGNQFVAIDKRFELVDRRFEHLENKIDSHFKWTVGIMITMFGSLLVTKFFL